MKPSIAVVVALATSLATSVATAAAAHADDRRHDGFYLRVGVGGGAAFGTLATTADSTSRGANVASELSVGVAVKPGLFVGGGTFPMVAPSPSYDGISAGGQHVSGTGPFVDYFPDPRGGLHLRAGVLFAAGYLDGSADRDGVVGVGAGATLGVGYDRFVSPQWSVGVMARVTAYQLYGVDDSIRLVSPSLLITLARN